MRFGTFETSYDNLPRMLNAIVERNPGSYYSLHDIPSSMEGQRILQRVFFSFAPCIRAFQYCRPLLCIDDTFLTGKYRGTILTAIGADGNNQLVPVAFAFVESENTDSWFLFLQRLKHHVVVNRPDVCLISDRHAGLLSAIDILKQAIWPDLHNR